MRPLIQPGERIEDYVVERHLGEGRWLYALLIRHQRYDSLHVLKIPKENPSGLPQRLNAQLALQKDIEHPNIVPIAEILYVDGSPAWITDYHEASTLAQALAKGVPSQTVHEQISAALVRGLGEAHKRGFFHGGLDPTDVLLTGEQGRLVPRIKDFATAYIVGGAGRMLAAEKPERASYVAPEYYADERKVSARTDVFSIGAILFEMTAGRLPFDGGDAKAVQEAAAKGAYLPPHAYRKDVEPRLEQAIVGALAPEPDRRIQDTNHLWAVLQGEKPGPIAVPVLPGDLPPKKHSPLLAFGVAAGGVAILLGIVAVLAFTNGPQGYEGVNPKLAAGGDTDEGPMTTGSPLAVLPADLTAGQAVVRLAAMDSYRWKPAATAYLGVLLQHDPDAEVRRQAFLLLLWRWEQGIGSSSETEALMVWAAGNAEAPSGREALDALGKRAKSVEAVAPLLDHEDPGIRSRAVDLVVDAAERSETPDFARDALETRLAVETDDAVLRKLKKALK